MVGLGAAAAGIAGPRKPIARGLLAFSLLVGAIPMLENEAKACSFAVRVVQASFPDEGATNVPTNVVLFVFGEEIGTQPITLRDSDGQPVALTVTRSGLGFDLAPDQALAPNRSFALNVGGTQALSFSTGNGPGTVIEEPPPPQLDLRQLTFELGTCGRLFTTCATAMSTEGAYTELHDEADFLSGGFTGQKQLSLPHGTSIKGCLTARTRDVAGHRSAPVEICGGNLAPRPITFSGNGNVCEATFLASSGGATSGCAVAPHRDAEMLSNFALVAAALSASRIRRHRKKGPDGVQQRIDAGCPTRRLTRWITSCRRSRSGNGC
jgi:hypothetical protein